MSNAVNAGGKSAVNSYKSERDKNQPGQEENSPGSTASSHGETRSALNTPKLRQRDANDRQGRTRTPSTGKSTHSPRADTILASQERTPQSTVHEDESGSSGAHTPESKKTLFSNLSGHKLRSPFSFRTPPKPPQSSTAGELSDSCYQTQRVERAPRWRQNLEQLIREFDGIGNFANTQQHGVQRTDTLPLWRKAFAMSLVPLANGMFDAIGASMKTMGNAKALALLDSRNAVDWEEFAECIALPACKVFLPSAPGKQAKTDMAAALFRQFPVEARIMLGEYVDEYRQSRTYKELIRQCSTDDMKKHLDGMILKAFIRGLEECVLLPQRSETSSGGETSSAHSRSRHSLRLALPPQSDRDDNEVKLFALVVKYLAKALQAQDTAHARTRGAEAQLQADMRIGDEYRARAESFIELLREEVYNWARQRSFYSEIKTDSSPYKEALEKARKEILPCLGTGMPGRATASTSETATESELRQGMWAGRCYPAHLYYRFVDRFDSIRIWCKLPDGRKEELLSVDQFIAYVLPDRQNGVPITQNDEALLFAVSYLANHQIEHFVRSAFFNGSFPLKTGTNRTVYPAAGTLQTFFVLQRDRAHRLQLRFSLRSDDVRAVELPRDAKRKEFTEVERELATNAAFKFAGLATFDERGFTGFAKPYVKALNFNVLVAESRESDASLMAASEFASSGGRSLERRVWSRNTRDSSSRGLPRSFEHRSEPDTPTKLTGAPKKKFSHSSEKHSSQDND